MKKNVKNLLVLIGLLLFCLAFSLIFSAAGRNAVKDTPVRKKEFENAGYAEFKRRVGEAVAAGVEPIRREKDRILSDKGYIDKLLASGAERAAAVAERTLRKVYKKVGLLPRVKA